MYALFQHGGHQYRADEQAVLRLQKIEAVPGDTVTFDQVLAVREDETMRVGTPYVAGASIRATVLQQGRGHKIRIVKYKRKKHYRRQAGHRQSYTAVRVEQIVA